MGDESVLSIGFFMCAAFRMGRNGKMQKRWQFALATRRAREKSALRREREEAERKARTKPRLVSDEDRAGNDQNIEATDS